ncbi:hypothetical protein C8J57DRAFT_1013256, partial [Mycena rebaudengoi]
ARIYELDGRILALENSLAAARSEREKLQSRLDDYKYPVLTLPAEITAEIFIHFLPIYPLHPPLTGLLSPVLLGQVCRKWRDVALGTPRLWSAIKIKVNLDMRFSAQVNLLQTWLARSKSCTLSLSVQRAKGKELKVAYNLPTCQKAPPFPVTRRRQPHSRVDRS